LVPLAGRTSYINTLGRIAFAAQARARARA